MQTLGKKQFTDFTERLKTPIRFYEPIRNNKILLFSRKPSATESKGKQSLQTLKDDRNLVSHPFISCQIRQCDLIQFFQHENQNSPPSLAQNGQMHQGTKSQLLPLLQQHASDIHDEEPTADVIIMDGAGLVNALRPTKGSTFETYAKVEVLSKLQKCIQKYKQAHIVFDVYKIDSMKTQTREKRGMGVRRKVVSTAKTPSNWHNFLRNY